MPVYLLLLVPVFILPKLAFLLAAQSVPKFPEIITLGYGTPSLVPCPPARSSTPI